jgi:HK97 family phage portal protein
MLDLLFGPPRRRLDESGWIGGSYWGTNRVKTRAGVEVDEALGLTYDAVWCATRLIAETAAQLPLILHQSTGDSGSRVADDHPVHDLVRCRPNPAMGAAVFHEGRTVHQVNWGNGFAEIEFDRRGDPLALWPIHPWRVRPTLPSETDELGRPLLPDYPYKVRNNDGSWVAFKRSEILHFPGAISEDGIWGKGVIAHARESIGMGLSTERHGATYFGSGAQPRGIVTVPGLKDREARTNFRAEWKEIHGSPDSAEIAILPVEGKFQPITINNEDSQFLETRKFNVATIARWYRLPLHMLMELQSATFNNVELFGSEFILYSMMTWLLKREEQCDLKLLTPEERAAGYFFRHDLTALLRGDTLARMQTYQVALTTGVYTLNDALRREHLPTIGPAGDKHFFAANNLATVEDLAAGRVPGMGGGPATGAASGGAGTGTTSPSPRSATPAAPSDQDRDLIELPDVRQQDNYSCGAAVAMSVGRYFDVGPESLEEWKAALDTTPENSTRPIKIIEYLTSLGLAVTAASDMTVEDLRDFWKDGMPVICPIQEYGLPSKQASFQYGHYVATIGVAHGQVFVQDPSIDNVLEGQGSDQAPGRSLIAESTWDSVWHDRDADGRQYVRFGIAVGRSVSDPDGDGEEEDDADTGQNPAAAAGPATRPAAV